MTRSRTPLLVAVVLAVASLGFAQDHPNLERGFFPDQVYQLSNIDSVNLYNGNLTLAIPIGQIYHVGGNLSWGLTLYYNSNVWDFEQEDFWLPHNGSCAEYDGIPTVTLTVAQPVGTANAGLGWTLSLGQLDGPYGKSDSPSWVYTSPDGSKHAFFQTLHDYGEALEHRTTSPCSSSAPCNIYYTRDNTYLRLVAIVDSCGKVLGGDVEFPDGTVQRFRTGNPACCSSGCSITAQLTQITDAFGNTLNVTYPSGNWQLSDGFRTTTVYFTTGLLGPQVDHVDVAAFGGATATYQFHYTTATICRSCKQDDMTGYCFSESKTVDVPLLVGISLPDGSSYCMNSDCTNFSGTPWYNISTAGCSGTSCTISPKDLPGTLQEMQLPTGGTIAWTYSPWTQDAAGGSCASTCSPTSTCAPSGFLPDVNESAGVSQRTVCDPVTSPGSPICGTWTYVHESPYTRNLAGAPNEARTTVTSPNGDDTVYYFRAQACFGVDTGSQPYRPYGWDYALPFTTNQNDGEASPNTKYLSTQLYRGTGTARTLLRSLYVRYDSDVNYLSQYGTLQAPAYPGYWYATNRRLSGQRTVYADDPGMYADVSYSGYDFVGHFRTASTNGNFASGNVRSATVDFNPTLTMPGVQWDGDLPWVLGTFDYQQQTEGSQSARQEFCFDATTGALLRSRVLASGTSEGASDLLRVYSYTSGNLTSEQAYGGDIQALGTGSLCSLALPATTQYRLDHIWQYGSLKSSRHIDPTGNPVSFFSLDLDIDANTGLAAASRDSAGLQTNYSYDRMGRLTWAMPATGQGAWIEHQYSPWSTTDAAYVDTCAKPNGVTTACTGASDNLARSVLRFDGLGRPFLAKTLVADGTWNQRKAVHNAMGWTTKVSEWYPNGTADASMSWTTASGLDPFGRPATVTAPDGSQVNFTYTGVRQTARRVSVSGSPATTTETYDRQGRLSSVQEPTGGLLAQYGYDVGGRLTSVNLSGSSGSQTRTFTYDNRGFLTSETLPEVGANGNGTMSYSNFDALGHLGRKQDGVHDLSFTYDSAERLTDVRVTGAGTALDTFAYATSSITGDWANGKLRTATAINPSITLPTGATGTITVSETTTYGGVGGAVSSEGTSIAVSGSATGDLSQSFTQGFAWNDLGQPASESYPSLPGVAPERTVYSGYSNGYLTKVLPNYATSITYRPNGMIASALHGNGVTDSQTADPNAMPRPASIFTQGATANGSAADWSTGTFGYDGAGNIKAMGSDSFAYDPLSRLTSGCSSVKAAPTPSPCETWPARSCGTSATIPPRRAGAGAGGRTTSTATGYSLPR